MLIILYYLYKGILVSRANIKGLIIVSAISCVIYTGYLTYKYVFQHKLSYIGIDLVNYGNSGRNSYALVLLIISSLVLGYLFEIPKNKKSIFWVCLSTALILYIVLLQSRGAILVIALDIIIIVILKRKLSNYKKLAVALIITCLAALLLIPSGIVQEISDKVFSIFAIFNSNISVKSSITSGSTEIREQLVQVAWDTFQRHPIFGVGLGNFQSYNFWQYPGAHNDYVTFCAEMGIVGGVCYLLVIGSFLVKSYKLFRHHANSITSGIFMAMASISLYSIFINAYDSFIVWTIYAMIGATDLYYRNTGESNENSLYIKSSAIKRGGA
jgi:O-antigen ligase